MIKKNIYAVSLVAKKTSMLKIWGKSYKHEYGTSFFFVNYSNIKCNHVIWVSTIQWMRKLFLYQKLLKTRFLSVHKKLFVWKKSQKNFHHLTSLFSDWQFPMNYLQHLKFIVSSFTLLRRRMTNFSIPLYSPLYRFISEWSHY